MEYDHVIIGSGIYGMYAAKILAERGKEVLILDCTFQLFNRFIIFSC